MCNIIAQTYLFRIYISMVWWRMNRPTGMVVYWDDGRRRQKRPARSYRRYAQFLMYGYEILLPRRSHRCALSFASCITSLQDNNSVAIIFNSLLLLLCFRYQVAPPLCPARDGSSEFRPSHDVRYLWRSSELSTKKLYARFLHEIFGEP